MSEQAPIYSSDRHALYQEEYQRMKTEGKAVTLAVTQDKQHYRILVTGECAFELHRRVAVRLEHK